MKRIVLIDDDSTTNYLNKLIIERAGIVDEVLAFESGQEALDFFHKNHNGAELSLVLLDINMPVMNAWQFLDQYQAITGDNSNKIVLLSSSINPADKQMAEKKENVLDFKSKPLSVDMLNDLVSSYLQAC
ncbi:MULTISPECIES: response regulator [unclassified Ekhidna]|jgi:CheY-like chemotaxis protein|uniref:response regulator n=1 Tax=unclassified Ekhidna TaxID=2632188 RepID=UPI0032DEBB98